MIPLERELTPPPATPRLAVQLEGWPLSQDRVAPPLPLSEGDRRGPEEFLRLRCEHRTATQQAHHSQVIRCRTDLQTEAVRSLLGLHVFGDCDFLDSFADFNQLRSSGFWVRFQFPTFCPFVRFVVVTDVT